MQSQGFCSSLFFCLSFPTPSHYTKYFGSRGFFHFFYLYEDGREAQSFCYILLRNDKKRKVRRRCNDNNIIHSLIWASSWRDFEMEKKKNVSLWYSIFFICLWLILIKNAHPRRRCMKYDDHCNVLSKKKIMHYIKPILDYAVPTTPPATDINYVPRPTRELSS